MLAGIYRLGAGQNERAEREFRAFLDSADPDTDDTSERLTASAALQLIALSRARKIIASGIKAARHSEVEEPLREAELLTPFDPGLWALRAALLLMIEPDRPERAFEALHRALTLDPDQPDVRAFSESLAAAVTQRPQQLALLGLQAQRVAALLALLPQPGTPPR
jgi:tetratricopeptide (TPR) repeat protein